MYRLSMKQFRKLANSTRRRVGRVSPQVREALNGPNQTERRFNLQILCNKGKFHPEPFTVSKTSRRRYTADYRWEYNGVPVIVEVKGSYKLPSEQRARLAWELACEQNPGSVFVWARNVDRGMWDVEAWYRGGRTTSRSICYCLGDLTKILQEVTK